MRGFLQFGAFCVSLAQLAPCLGSTTPSETELYHWILEQSASSSALMPPASSRLTWRKRDRGSSMVVTLIYGNETLWRCNDDTPYLSSGYTDTACVDSEEWSLDIRSLNRRTTSAQSDPEHRTTNLGPALADLRLVASQGLAYVGNSNQLSKLEFQFDHNRWTGQVNCTSGARVVLEGEWSESPAANAKPGGWDFTVTRAAYFNPNREVPVFDFRLSGVVFDALLGHPIPTEVRDVANDRAWEWMGSEQLSTEYIREVTRCPTPAGDDPIRGKLNVSQYLDMRNNSADVRLKHGEEWVQVPMTRGGEAKRTPIRTVIGWSVGGLVLVILVYGRIRRVAGMQHR